MTDTEEINRLYYDKKMSLRQVAAATGHGQHYIKKRLKYGPRSTREALLIRSTPEYREKLRIKQLGELGHNSKLTDENVLSIRREYTQLLNSLNKHQSQKILAEKYGVKRPTISDVVLRKTWTHI